jgi:hypothetical protein
VHNPFPQLAKVAVAPFFNHSMEPTLDVLQVSNAYFHELQSVPGFEVVPLAVVETTMLSQHLVLNRPSDARRLAQLLDVDAVVTGAVTDYYPYYPPRLALHVEWYAANPGFHPIPAGYGLPWGTQEEHEIPRSLVFEAEFALAKEQMKTQTPPYPKLPQNPVNPLPPVNPANPVNQVNPANPVNPPAPGSSNTEKNGVRPASAEQPMVADGKGGVVATVPAEATVAGESAPIWPDPRGFIPPPPQPYPPPYCPSDAPVLRHTRTYCGSDADFTTALENYHNFRDDARFDGWQGYLQRSDDFIRFCCHMHIWEMLTARGGAGETRVVWHWPVIR